MKQLNNTIFSIKVNFANEFDNARTDQNPHQNDEWNFL